MTPPALKLSIIIPAHNEEEHIRFALESALMQRVDFDFEVIVIDDGSDDGTSRVVREYQQRFDNLLLVRNEKNSGKGASFRTAYRLSRGEYFHILDADDYFLSYDKLQKQVDALDSMPHVCAVAHNCLIVYEDNTIEVANTYQRAFDYPYEEVIRFRHHFYTSTYMFRKVTDDLPAEFETARGLRGDTACLYFHAFTTKLGVHYMSGIMSVYDFHGQGIWSGISSTQQTEVNYDVFSHIRDYIVKDPSLVEYTLLTKIVESLISKKTVRQPPAGRLLAADVFNACSAVVSRLTEPAVYQTIFRGTHFQGVIDQLCEAMGRLALVHADLPMTDRKYDDNKVAFLVAGVRPENQETYGEIRDLIDMHLNALDSVLLLITDIADSDMPAISRLLGGPRIELRKISAPTQPEQLWSIIEALYKAAPHRLYPYIGYSSVVGCAAVQKGLAKEIVLQYGTDHGSSLGVTNSAVDKIVFKSARQMETVIKVVPHAKCLLIPPLLKSIVGRNPYIPLRKAKPTTASATSLSCNIVMSNQARYCDLVINILKRTQGQHVHFGPLSEADIEHIEQALFACELSPTQFIHIPSTELCYQKLIDLKVDLFITIFPAAAVKFGIQAMSCGIPLAYYRAGNVMLYDAIDFGDPQQWSWTTPGQLYSILEALTPERLLEKSKIARAHFDKYHDLSKHGSKQLELIGQPYPPHVPPALPFNDVILKRLYPVDEVLDLIERGHISTRC